jgi:NAD(P)H-nitrite reductase large subunit
LIKSWCESKGVTVHTSTKVTRITQPKPSGTVQRVLNAVGLGSETETGHHLQVSLDNGHELEAALVISAAGVKPNIDFLQGSGVELDQGILVNHFMQTNVAEIYAAGDVAQGRDFSTGEYQVHAIQPTASDHGRVAALNMTGANSEFQGSFNMNVLDTLGLVSSSFGLWMGVEGGDSVELCDPEGYRYLRLEFQDDRLVGANSLGHTDHIGAVRGLIQGRVDLGDWKERLMRDPSRVVEAYLARNYLAFP